MKKCGEISSRIKYVSIFKTRNLLVRKIYLHTKLNAEKKSTPKTTHFFALFITSVRRK